ncbi:effector binding domain-containing protein [Bacillus sp. MUM 13]|uniref:GyrI-like domain-containing protein n=1 Tax=Bacillus sp. MUM 13 TaxID=1678001 RepID=UPI0008F5A2CD|nr:effector binding domain-containing protein [Bacillus sp. MUM 13]OIK06475.1 AraC family transcriptional regulator [Bacillus sp. MUM 13]
MQFREILKQSFVILGFSAPGKWSGEMVHPIPDLLDQSYKEFGKDKENIIGVCLPPRSDHYFYTCGIEIEEVDFHKVKKGMTLHTFPEQRYFVFTHIGNANEIPNTYGQIWEIFDRKGYSIKKGMPEIEVVKSQMFGKEYTNEYEMEIWIPVN